MGKSICDRCTDSSNSNNHSSSNSISNSNSAAHRTATAAPTENGVDGDHGSKRTPQYPRFDLIKIIGHYETSQQQQQQQQQNYCRGNHETKHFTKFASYNNPVTWSTAHLTDEHHEGKWLR